VKKIFLSLLLVISCQLSVVPVFGAGEFETTYTVRYEVKTDGLVHVSQTISLKNKLSSLYATRYSLSLPSENIKNIIAADNTGSLKTDIRRENGTTNLDLFFNEQVVGLDKTYTFTINYDSLDLAQKNGQVWEVFLPKLANSEEDSAYTATLAIPQSFGNPAFINPEPVEKTTEGNFNLYRFTKNQLLGSGVSAAFGQFQIFDFALSYHLKNPNAGPGETEVALPPDTAFQQLSYQKIEPTPVRVSLDQDGNWLATYKLKPAEKITINVAGKAKIFATPQTAFAPSPPLNLDQNLAPAKYWESDSQLIKNTAKNLKTPREVYNFVVKTLDYDFNRVNQEGIVRKGAAAALLAPKNAICMEFTDLFVALARAAGIPAREINGYAQTTDQKLQPLNLVADVLHAWPEYWDENQKTWIPVDPTWEKTTGGLDYFSKTDLNHFTFAIHGQSSTQPPPAGSYRDTEVAGKDVQVVFGRYEQESLARLTAKFNLPKRILWQKAITGDLTLRNEGPRALYNSKVLLAGEKVTITSGSSREITLAALPPYGEAKIPLKISAPGWLDYGQGKVLVTANGQEFTATIEIGLIAWPLIFLILGVALLFGVCLAVVIKSKRRHD